jgi:hypothetical protein
MGLDPTSLFEPQLGGSWQSVSTEFDPRSYYRRRERCVNLSRAARIDPDSVKVKELLDCPAQNGFGE